jgi:hypothetical protein
MDGLERLFVSDSLMVWVIREVEYEEIEVMHQVLLKMQAL